ncbi:MAG: rRNA maturation RNase YbeY [Clostridiales bacterium]|nr:rRNA maturation RNase YbeY [Clostridiales bacterium]
MALKIDIETDEATITTDGIENIIETVCKECALGYKESLYAGVHLTGDDQIRKINSEYRKIDKPTDVLSFPLLTADNGKIEFSDLDRDMETGFVLIGDIIISMDRAVAQAEEYGHSIEREVAFLTCHGILHLLGYNHDDERAEENLIKKQKQILNKLGYRK